MKLSLMVMTPGKQEGKSLEVKLTQFVIGRDPQCHLRPASPMISKRHCAILQRDGKAFLRDFGSTNGSFVNDEPIKGEVELKNDDRLKIGPLLFTVKLEATTPVNRPTPPPATRNADKPAAAAKPKPPAADPTPPPPTKLDKADTSDDDDIAAMLLSLGDEEGATPSATAAAGTDQVPDGSTQMEIAVPSGVAGSETAGGAPASKDEKKEEKKDEKKEPKKDTQANTADAAKLILEQMMRRPRA